MLLLVIYINTELIKYYVIDSCPIASLTIFTRTLKNLSVNIIMSVLLVNNTPWVAAGRDLQSSQGPGGAHPGSTPHSRVVQTPGLQRSVW